MFIRLSRAMVKLDYQLPSTREELEQLSGISQYMTALDALSAPRAAPYSGSKTP